MARRVRRFLPLAGVVVPVWLGLAGLAPAAPAPQQTYASPEEAVGALVAAARSDDHGALQAVFGPEGDRLIASGDPYADRAQLRRFVAAYDEKHALVPKGPGRMELDVGSDDWPLPIPVVQADGRWKFDTGAGAEELIRRRIGRNELSAIRASLAYVDAQNDYFARMQQQGGTGFYAERLISRPGRRDGLYWPVAAGEAESPLAALIGQAEEEGYPGATGGGKPIPYHGYYFRILRAQGPDAPGGAKDYVQAGRLAGGFGLIAWPAEYGTSGIMSFEVSQDRIVFQKDLGPESAQAAQKITRFDPDLTWARVDLADR